MNIMISEGSQEGERTKIEIPLIDSVILESHQLLVVKYLLEGTDSDEWLKETEDKFK